MSSNRKDHEMKKVFLRADHQINTENICEKPNMKRLRKAIARKNIKSTESHLKESKQKKKLIYITKFLAKVTCYLFIGMSSLQTTVCWKVRNSFSYKIEQPQKGYEKSPCCQGIASILTAGTTSSISMENTN